MKYIYPAVFSDTENGVINVSFPDFKACFTYGYSLSEALDMAEDVLSLTLCDMENSGEDIPAPSDIRSLHTEPGTFLTLIRCDTDSYSSHVTVSDSMKKR
jgi:predicted RNase H-like HicB family nuclease